jgi:hypothetical protein
MPTGAVSLHKAEVGDIGNAIEIATVAVHQCGRGVCKP